MSSEFQILKVLIYLTKVDGNVHKLERIFIKDRIKQYGFSEKEKLELLSEFDAPSTNYIDAFNSLESYRDRETVLSFARHMFQLDDEFHPNEKLAYQQLKDIHDGQSKDMQEASLLAGESLIKEQNKTQFMKELNIFGDELGKRRGFFYRYMHVKYPSLLIYSLYRSGSIGRKFAVFLVLAAIAFWCFRFLYLR